jgi:carboxylesterase type B
MGTLEMLSRRITIEAAAKMTGVSQKTVKIWMNPGLDGVRLASIKVGGRRYTSPEAIAAFIESSSAVRPGSTPMETPRRHNMRRARQMADAGAILAQDGI